MIDVLQLVLHAAEYRSTSAAEFQKPMPVFFS
jgi:hypothetical protein